MSNQCTNESVARLISTVHRHGYMHLSKRFEPYGLGQGQVKFLMVLFEQNEQSQEQMANVLNIDKTTTARAVKKLEEEGYVTRRSHELDRRAYIVSLTKKSLEIEPVIRSILDNWISVLTENFTDEEKETAMDLLKRMAENAVKKIHIEEDVEVK